LNIKTLKKLTEEQKQEITSVLNEIFPPFSSEDSSDSEYVTEYDILMEQKREAFKLQLLEDDEPLQIDALLEMCEGYLKAKDDGNTFPAVFAFTIMYDMWLNKSAVWPVMHNPEWEEWKKLKDIKVKRKGDKNVF
jgi:hypothetical protein